MSGCANALSTTKKGEDVTKLLDDRWFPLIEASIPAEGLTALPSPPSQTSRCSTSQRDTVRMALLSRDPEFTSVRNGAVYRFAFKEGEGMFDAGVPP